MIQSLFMLNIHQLDKEQNKFIEGIELRGYNNDVFIPSEFRNKMKDKKIKPLSVSNIADFMCPTRRNLYFVKGVSNLTKVPDKDTWWRRAGNFIEKYSEFLFNMKSKISNEDYDEIKKSGSKAISSFVKNNQDQISKLKKLEISSNTNIAGNTERLLECLELNGKKEIFLKHAHEKIKNENSINFMDVKFKEQINPNVLDIGINSPSEPDFLVPNHCAIGDIKTSNIYKISYPLTLAGYALAYENAIGETSEINWGVICFLQNQSPSEYYHMLTSSQTYIFPIDDVLRSWFIEFRNIAYEIISQDTVPPLPPENDRKNCDYCRFKHHCFPKNEESNQDE